MKVDPRQERASDTHPATDENGNGGEDKSDGQRNLDLYEPDARKSVVVPGSGGTLSGTAFTDWIDADGNLKPEHNHPLEESEVPQAPEAEESPEPQEPPDE
ncbi:MAG: hypothetical protein LLG14_17035 [Nocardiaceae bacterium]|nr:hypothetical protein [Nocardiaceae bacterium]